MCMDLGEGDERTSSAPKRRGSEISADISSTEISNKKEPKQGLC